MGSSFTNVQVHIGARPLASLIDAIVADAGDAQRVSEASDATRTVYVLPPDRGGWASIYDERTEAQDGTSLDALGALASRALSTAAFTVLLHDSDILVLALFGAGKLLDRYDSNPGYFGGRVSKKTRAAVAGDAEKWRALLSAASVDELRALFADTELYAEGKLEKLSEFVGCDATRACSGERYVTHDEAPLPEGTVTLRFREHGAGAQAAAFEGPPRFEWRGSDEEKPHVRSVGDEFSLIVDAGNYGASSMGLSFIFWGTAIDDGLVVIECLRLVFREPSGKIERHTGVPVQARSSAGEALQVLELPAQAIPGGAFTPMCGVLLEDPGAVGVEFVGRVTKSGRGDLACAFVPHANREHGTTARRLSLTIDGPLRRPLRAVATRQSHSDPSYMLRPLADDRFLVALAAIDESRNAMTALALELIEGLLTAFGSVGELSYSIFHREPGRMPKGGSGKTKTLLRGKRLEQLAQAMRNDPLVGVMSYAGPSFDAEAGPCAPQWGLEFGTTTDGEREAERVPTVAIFADAVALGPNRAADLRARWLDLLDRAQMNDGIQAVVFRTGSNNGVGAPVSTSSTPYEMACDVPESLVTSREWLTRWVRVPGNDVLWLGDALSARLDDESRARLRSIADVEVRANGLRIALRGREHEGTLELAIAALLPTHADATEAWSVWQQHSALH